MSEKLDYHRRYIEFLKEFGDEEYLYVVIDGSGDLNLAKQFADEVAKEARAIDDIKQVIWKIDNPLLEKNFLLYLREKELDSLGRMLSTGPFAAKNIAGWSDISPLFGALATRINQPVSKKDEAELATGFTFLDNLVDDISAAMDAPRPYVSRLQSLFFGSAESFDKDGYIKSGDLLFVLIMPKKDYATSSVIEAPLKQIRDSLELVRSKFPGINAGLTGRPVLSADEMTTSNNDMAKAGALAAVLMMGLFILSFRGIVRPLLAQITLGIGIAWTFGFVALAFGTLNILSIVFALILIGAVMEYAFRFIARYQEELSKCGVVNDAVVHTFVKSGIPDITSAVTTACVFLTLLWTDFTALAQLGVVAAVGVILCVAAILIVLPSLIVIVDRRLTPEKIKAVSPFQFTQIGRLYKKPWALALTSAVITVSLIYFTTNVRFDNNLLKLQSQNLESVKYENLIIEKSSETTWFARAIANSVEESQELAEKFRSLPTVRRVDDVLRVFPENQPAKAGIISEIAPNFAGLSFSVPSENINPRELMFELGRLSASLTSLQAQAFSSGRVDAVEELGGFAEKIDKLSKKIGVASDDELSRLGKYQFTFISDMHEQMKLLAGGMNPSKIELKDVPSDLLGRFMSPAGRFALFIYPRDDIWDPAALKRFVDDIRSVDAYVVGTPIEVHESGKIMQTTFINTAILALIVTIFFAWLDTRSWRATILSVIPLCLGTTWLIGIMGLWGIDFNMANFFAIPILIGTGIDFGIHMTHRIRHDKSLKAVETSTGRGLMLTAVSNALGFGSMMIASHHGIVSLGKIMLIGSICSFLAAMIALPPMAKRLNWGNSKASPVDTVR